MGRYEEEYMKKCPYCESVFEAGRINQKFCDKKCKYRFNNRLRKQREVKKLPHQRVLNRNLSVLESIFKTKKGDKKLYSKTELINKGFSFQYLTRSVITESGKNAIGVYNFFLCLEKEDYYSIIKAA